MSGDKTRIAILGGGIGALSAAFDLSEHDPHGDRTDITIYTIGWRLGGKAAVGRDEESKALEHGLHIWAGFYDNAFDLVQRLYRALGHQDGWRQAFEPLNHVTLMEAIGDQWESWGIGFRANGSDPGIEQTWSSPVHPVKKLLNLLVRGADEARLSESLDEATTERLQEAVSRICREPVSLPPLAAAAALVSGWPDDPRRVSSEQSVTVLRLLELAHGSVADARGRLAGDDGRARHAWILVDLGLAFVKGVLESGVLVDGFEAIDGEEWSDWLGGYGCQPENLQSAPMRACYDYVFGYLEGVRNVGAGTGAHALLRFLLFYKGSVFYRLRAPMGDFLLAPLYRLLKQRGVKFEFFHRLDALKLSADGEVVSEIVFGRQVALRDLDREYFPLHRTADGESWPALPDYGQIKDGDSAKGYDLESAWTDWKGVGARTLVLRSSAESGGAARDHRDTFDLAILGIGLGALGPICGELIARHPRWRDLLTRVRTTPTLAVQLWTATTTGALGWPDPQTILTGFEKPGDDWKDAGLSTWQDNSDLLALENPGVGARGLGYFVGVFPDLEPPPPPGPDPDFPRREYDRANAAAERFITGRLKVLWPRLDPTTSILRRYVRANINPSDRYVLSASASAAFRLAADGSGIRNLLLAGDWVRTSLNAGCIEAAITAGRTAASAITGGKMPTTGDNAGASLPLGLLPLANIFDKVRHSVAGGVGSIDAFCIITEVDSATALAKLPHGLTPDLPRSWNGKPKLINLFCRQRHVRPGIVPLGGMNYREFLQLIPYVVRDKADGTDNGPFAYMTLGVLDEMAPVAIGINLYGFNKRLGQLSGEAGSFDIRSDLGEVSVMLRGEGLPRSINNFANLRDVRPLMEQPLIANATNGSWVYSYLDFRLDTATFQAASGTAYATRDLIPGWEDPPQTIKSIADVPFGAFRLTSKWELSFPLSAGDLTQPSPASGLPTLSSLWRDLSARGGLPRR